MQDGINNNATYAFNLKYSNYTYMYYTNSEAKTTLENWYQTNIGSKSNLASKVVTVDYYCEQAKVKFLGDTSGNATMSVYTSYTPNFKCETDGNGKGLVNENIGLLTYDEVVYAGGYFNVQNISYYLTNSLITWWSMSPAGFSTTHSNVWFVDGNGMFNDYTTSNIYALRPVINLKSDIQISDGDGTKDNPFVVE